MANGYKWSQVCQSESIISRNPPVTRLRANEWARLNDDHFQRPNGYLTMPLSMCWLRFAAFWSVIAVCWLVLLPWLAAQPELAARIKTLERAGIDPSAMYYSELEMMPDTLRRLEQLHARDHRLLWALK
jgi:hypothetical protein